MNERNIHRLNSDSRSNSFSEKVSNENDIEQFVESSRSVSGNDIMFDKSQSQSSQVASNQSDDVGVHRNSNSHLNQTLDDQESELIQRELQSRLRGGIQNRRSTITNSVFDFERISLESCFTPFKFPGKIDDAMFHAEANLLGEMNESVADFEADSVSPFVQQKSLLRECQCCGKLKKAKQLEFWKLNYDCITESYGKSIVYLFRMNQIFIVCISVIFLTYLIYFQIQVENLCEEKAQAASIDATLQSTQCIKVLYWSLMSELQLRRESNSEVQIVLAHLKFVLLILLQTTNIVFFQSSNFIKKQSKQDEHLLTKLRKKSLILHHIPEEYSEQEVTKNIQVLVRNTYNVSVSIACVTNIYDCSEKYKLANKRMRLLENYYYYEAKSMKGELNPKQQQRFKACRQGLIENQRRFKGVRKEFGGVIIVTFASQRDRTIVESLLNKSYFLNIAQSIKRVFKLASDLNTVRRMTCTKAPQLNEINWQNIGSKKAKIKLYSLIAGFTLMIFIGIPRLTEWLFSVQFANVNMKQSFSDKYVDYGVSVCLFAISNIVWLGMKYLLRKSYVATTFYQSLYLLISNLAFHLQFYIIVPIFLSYFTQDLDVATISYEHLNIRLYGIATLIAGFSGLSVVEIVCSTGAIWKWFRKWQLLRKDKQLFQQRLNDAFQRAQFPIEKRVLILYKQYAFGIVISFIIPIAWAFVLLGLIFQYIGNRFSLVNFFSMYTYYNIKIINKATRIASLALMYVVTILYLQTEKQAGLYTPDYYMDIAKYMLIFNVLANIIYERIKKAIKKRKKTQHILQQMASNRTPYINTSINATQSSSNQTRSQIHNLNPKPAPVDDEDEQMSLYKYYNVYESFQNKINPSWSNDRIERILNYSQEHRLNSRLQQSQPLRKSEFYTEPYTKANTHKIFN